MSEPLHALSAAELSRGYRTKQLSPVEVTRAVLERIELWEKHINAMYVIDADGALAQAAASAARWRAGESRSPLDGVPITIKDNITTKGTPTPIGTAAADLTPAIADSPPAARVREAGCIILGKTTMPDYGMLASGVSSLHGITRNPWDLTRNPAGSSSGAGAGLVAGYGPLALGTDIGGSVRLPAAYTGTFALKPSLGRVPIYPPYLGRVTGPMTRTVDDAALLMSELSKPDIRDYMSLPYQSQDWANLRPMALKNKRLGLVLNIGAGLSPQAAVSAAVTEAAKAFETAGAIVEPVAGFIDDEMLGGFDRFLAARLLADVELLSPERQGKVLSFVLNWCRRARPWSAVEALRSLNHIMRMREAAVRATAGYDFLLSPTSAITAYAAEAPAPGNDPQRALRHVAFTAPFNMSEQPAASLCAGYDVDGLPIGLQIIGHRFDDLGVLGLARAYEDLRPQLRAWPAAAGQPGL